LGGKIFGFVPLPMTFLLVLAGFIVSYMGLTELMKRWFYRRFSNGTKPMG
jgi:hypothetical protein